MIDDLPESMREDQLGACRGLMNGCLFILACAGLLFLIAVIVFIPLRGL